MKSESNNSVETYIGYKRMHYFSGVLITLFIFPHLANQVCSLIGIETHIEVMRCLRLVYRNPVVETILLLAIAVQIRSGLHLLKNKPKKWTFSFFSLRIYSGIYMAIFFIFHLFAVFAGRVIGMETNFYFAAAGLNTWPLNLYYVPYYSLAIISFFGHLSAVHYMKMKRNLFFLSPSAQSIIILIFGGLITFSIIFGMTNRLRGIDLPEEYKILIGK